MLNIKFINVTVQKHIMQDESYFIKYLGSSPMIKILDCLLTFREYDYSLTEISENSGVSWSTINNIFPKLIKLNVVLETRKIGRATLYKLNEDNPVVQQMIILEEEIIREVSGMKVITKKTVQNPSLF